MQSTPSGNLVLRRQRRQRQQQQQQQCPEPPADEEQEAATSAAKPFFNWTKSNPDGRLKLHMDPFSSFRHFHQHEPEHQNYDHAPPSLLLNPIPNHFHNSQYHSESLPHTRHGLTFSETSLLPSLLGNAVYNYPFDQSGLDFMSDSFGFLGSLPESQAMSSSPVLVGFTGVNSQPRLIDSDLSFVSPNSGTQYLPWVDDDGDSAALPLYLDGNGGNPPFLNRPKTLGRPPPEICSSPAGSDSISHPNLFQKRLALHVDSGENKGGNIRKPIQENFHMPVGFNLDKGKELAHEEQPFVNNKNNKTVEGDVDDEIKISGLESHSDEDYFPGENANHVFEMEMEMEIYNANSSVLTGDDKEKKGGRLPAKNLMAERRRRKKLNDRLYMLRSVVPKISKMDRASILADAIEYLKELLQRIKNINDELQALTAATPLQSSSSIVPQTSPIPAALPHPVKGEACKNSLPNPVNQPPTVHVEVREENAFNIHMFCSRRPGLMLSSLTALDNLGLDIHQAVISCFNEFALDVFRAEKCNAAMELHQDQIKAILLDAAAFHGLM